MKPQNDENSLTNAKNSIRRTSTKKSEKSSSAPRESLSERLSRLAEERASEALYAEQYREKLLRQKAESADAEKTDSPTRVTENTQDCGATAQETAFTEVNTQETADTEVNTQVEAAASEAEAQSCDTDVSEERNIENDTPAVSEDDKEPLQAEDGGACGVTSAERENPTPNGYILIPAFPDREPPTFCDTYAQGAEFYGAQGVSEDGYGSPFDYGFIPNVSMSGYTDATMEREYYANADIRPPRYTAETEPDLDDYAIDLGGYRINEDYADPENEPRTSHVFDDMPEELMYPEFSDIDERYSAKEEDVRFFVDDIEENVRLVELRMLYEAEMLKNRHKMLKYRFSLDENEIYLSRRNAEREVNRRLSKIAAAKRYERAANRRYYLAAEDRCVGKMKKRAKNAALIESLGRRLDFLLTERASINRRLVELYTGSVIDSQRPVQDKGRRRAIVKARRVYKSQRPLAKRVLRLKAPEQLREKIIKLMNEKTEAYANIEYLESRLKKERPSRAVRVSIKRQIKQEKKKIRYANYDIKLFVKKAEKHNTVFYENGKQLAWIFGVMAAIAVGIGIYLAYGDAIGSFFSSLF